MNTASALWPLFLFAVAASFSPGPNNIMVMSTAARLGFRRTIPMAIGIVAGFGFMVSVVGIGLAVPLQRFPALVGVMRWAGAIWLLVLAWKIGGAPGNTDGSERPAMGFGAAAGFQWINPKAWIMAVAAAATFTIAGHGPVAASLLRAAVFACVGLVSIASWMLLGLGAGRFLATPRRLRRFNVAMGALLAASVVPAVLE